MTQAAFRSAVKALLEDCADDADVQLQTYAGRPKALYPPTAFIDAMHDQTEDFVQGLGGTVFQHNAQIDVILVWGLYDSEVAVKQRDAFVDAFHDWIRDDFHAAGAESLIGPRTLDDLPAFVPDWLPEEQQFSYFATRLVLEGFVTD